MVIKTATKNELGLCKQDTTKKILITPKQTGPTKGHTEIPQSIGTKDNKLF